MLSAGIKKAPDLIILRSRANIHIRGATLIQFCITTEPSSRIPTYPRRVTSVPTSIHFGSPSADHITQIPMGSFHRPSLSVMRITCLFPASTVYGCHYKRLRCNCQEDSEKFYRSYAGEALSDWRRKTFTEPERRLKEDRFCFRRLSKEIAFLRTKDYNLY